MPAVVMLWAAAGVLAAIGLRRRQGATLSPSGPPPLLRAVARLPAPSSLRRIAARAGTEERLREAGLAERVSVARVARARAGGAATGLATAFVLGVVSTPAALCGLALAAAGYFAPDWWIGRSARERRAEMVRDLPDLLDLLGVCVSAGMPLDAALAITGSQMEGPLGAELRRTLRDLRLGTPRRAAYAALAERSGTPELARTVAALIQADELGAPIADAVRAQAGELRSAQDAAAREGAAKAAPKIQLVVALTMVPAVMLVVMAVLIAELARQVGVVVSG